MVIHIQNDMFYFYSQLVPTVLSVYNMSIQWQ